MMSLPPRGACKNNPSSTPPDLGRKRTGGWKVEAADGSPRNTGCVQTPRDDDSPCQTHGGQAGLRCWGRGWGGGCRRPGVSPAHGVARTAPGEQHTRPAQVESSHSPTPTNIRAPLYLRIVLGRQRRLRTSQEHRPWGGWTTNDNCLSESHVFHAHRLTLIILPRASCSWRKATCYVCDGIPQDLPPGGHTAWLGSQPQSTGELVGIRTLTFRHSRPCPNMPNTP